MKKVFQLSLLVMSVSVLFIACKTSNTHYSKKVNLDGNYFLESVNVSGLQANEKYSITLFDDVKKDCFVGSEWYLPHNGNGSYTIANGNNCNMGTRHIKWSLKTVRGVSTFQMKVLDGRKAKNVEEGYTMTLVNATKQGFVLEAPVYFNGKELNITYTFVRK